MVDFLTATGQTQAGELLINQPNQQLFTTPGGDIRSISALNDPPVAPSLSFPSELKDADSSIPFMLFQVVEYPTTVSKQFINDLAGASSVLDVATTLGNAVTGNAQILHQTSGIGNVYATVAPKVKYNIQLPVTNNVANSLGISWEMTGMAGTQAAIGLLKAGAITATDLQNGNIMGAGETLGKGVGNALLAGNVALYSDLLKKTVNVIANPKMQALFNGVEPRSFQFDFTFTATNQKEADTIEKIIYAFSKYSLPDISMGDLIMDFPHEFLISFHDPSNSNIDTPLAGFPILRSCVCIAVQTNYTPNGLQILKDGHALQIVLSMAFMETTLRTNNDPGLTRPVGF